MSDEGLRQAYARAIAGRTPGERGACPAPEAILALVRREGGEERRLMVLDHVMACPACRDEFELLRSIDRAGARAGAREQPAAGTAASPAARVVGHIAWRRWAPLAAAAVILIIALGPGRRLWQPSPDTVRGGGDGVALIAPADAASPSSGPVAFSWHAVPESERYTLELMTAAGEVALSRATTDTTMTLILPGSVTPGDYRWWVTATSTDGTVTRSAVRTLRLRGR